MAATASGAARGFCGHAGQGLCLGAHRVFSAERLERCEPSGSFVFLDFYGVRVDVQLDDAEVHRRLENDLSHFRVESLDPPASLEVRGSVATPGCVTFLSLKAEF